MPARPHRAAAGRLQPAGLTTAGLAAGLTVATAVAALCAIATHAQPVAASASTRVLARDTMHRTVRAGFGTAIVGGSYTVSSTAHTSVVPGTGRFTSIAHGTSVVVRLDHARATNTSSELTFTVPRQSASGNGLYITLETRRQANRDGYLANVHIAPTGATSLSISRYLRGNEVFLTGERQVTRTRPGQILTVVAGTSATNAVQLSATLWSGTASTRHTSAWRVATTDARANRISAAGSVAIAAYLSNGARSACSLGLKGFAAWSSATAPPAASPKPPTSAAPSKPPATTPPTSTPPSTVPPSSAPPTTEPPTATPPTTAAPTAGAAPIGSTDYPVPYGAVFVSPDGNDANRGTEAAPLRTLGRAISAAPSGATIVLRAGNYHENVTVQANKSLTIQSYPHEAVWLDGSTPVTGWTHTGNVWVHDGWTVKFGSTASYTGTVSTDPAFVFVNSAYPMAAHPDQVWLGATALTQVGSAAAVQPGTFYADYANNQLVIGSDPSAQDVTASTANVALTAYGPNVLVRGIGVRKYATAIADMGALRLAGPGDGLENVVADDNATTGIDISGPQNTLRNVTASANGMLGLGATYADDLSVVGYYATGNNAEHFNSAPVSGGINIGRSRGVAVRDSAVVGNLGVGVWFDESTYDITLTGNTIARNASHGAVTEISAVALIADNVITGNGGMGIKINDTNDVQVWNNTITGNASQVQILQDERRGSDPSVPGHDPRQNQPDATEPWVISDESLMNNVIGPGVNGASLVVLRDYTGQYAASELRPNISGNAFVTSTGGSVMQWGTHSGVITYGTVSAFQSETGQVGNCSADAASRAAESGGRPLPVSVAGAVGQPAGSLHVGAFGAERSAVAS